MHLSEVTTALPLLEAAGLHLYSLAQLMLFAFFVSKGSLFLCELHAVRAAALHGSTSPQFYLIFLVCTTTESKQTGNDISGHGTEHR